MIQEPPTCEVLLTPREAAARLRRSVGTLGWWRRAGCGPVYIKLEAGIFYSERDIDDYIRRGRVQPGVRSVERRGGQTMTGG